MKMDFNDKPAQKPKTISVSQLGLAAYIRMRGAPLVDVRGKQFVFETERDIHFWRIEYANSECSRHDALVCELRNSLRPQQA